MPSAFGNFPSINELLDSPPLKSLVERVNPTRVMSGVRSFVDGMRHELQTAVKERQIPSPVALAEQIAQWIMRQEHAGVRSVINATGIVLHPDFGGAPLAEEALLALRMAAGNFTRQGLASGGVSPARVEQLLRELTGCEAALVVNNATAALSLVTCACAARRDVLLPQSQLGASWQGMRTFDLIEPAGGRLRPVGAVNETMLSDFTQAATGEAGMVLWQEGLTYQIITAGEPLSLAQLGVWSRQRSLPLVVELGHGGLVDGVAYGLPAQPTIAAAEQSGASLVIARGDALLGGPACGIIAGRASYLKQVAAHPLLATVRCDKLTLAALEATLELYQAAAGQPASALERSIPLWGLLGASLDNLKHRCERLAPQLSACKALATVDVLPAAASITGATKVASQQLATCVLSLKPAQGTAADLLATLAAGSPAVIGKLEGDRVWLDLRAVSPAEDQQIVQAVEQLGKPTATAM